MAGISILGRQTKNKHLQFGRTCRLVLKKLAVEGGGGVQPRPQGRAGVHAARRPAKNLSHIFHGRPLKLPLSSSRGASGPSHSSWQNSKQTLLSSLLPSVPPSLHPSIHLSPQTTNHSHVCGACAQSTVCAPLTHPPPRSS